MGEGEGRKSFHSSSAPISIFYTSFPPEMYVRMGENRTSASSRTSFSLHFRSSHSIPLLGQLNCPPPLPPCLVGVRGGAFLLLLLRPPCHPLSRHATHSRHLTNNRQPTARCLLLLLLHLLFSQTIWAWCWRKRGEKERQKNLSARASGKMPLNIFGFLL